MPELSDHPPTAARPIPEPMAEPVLDPEVPPAPARSTADTSRPATAGSDAAAPAGDTAGNPRTRGKAPAQWAFRARASLPVRIGMTMFALGVLAIAVIMVLFASGSHDLPLWLNLSAMLAPLGFAVGMAGVAVDARRSSRALASSTTGEDSPR